MKKRLQPLRTGRPVRPRKAINGAKLRALRHDADLSMGQLAQLASVKCGIAVTENILQTAETGETRLSDVVLEAVCKVLRVKVDDLVIGSKESL